jgi:hypothetical protein
MTSPFRKLPSPRLLACLVLTLVAFAVAASVPAYAVPPAAFTTFDATTGGCFDSPNGVDCNNYAAKGDVYMNGGPGGGSLNDGTYYFVVLAPGFQNGGFLDGANGNLSDTTASNGGTGSSGDLIVNRTFSMLGGVMTYSGTHSLGTDPQGHQIIQLMPYDDTPNPGGVYILAICSINAKSPSDCKYDAFRISAGTGNCTSECGGPATLTVCKFWDQNDNNALDDEPLLGAWPITAKYSDGNNGTVTDTENTVNTVVAGVPDPSLGCATFTVNIPDGTNSVNVTLSEASSPLAGSVYCASGGCPLNTPSGSWFQTAPFVGGAVQPTETVTVNVGDVDIAPPFGNDITLSAPSVTKTAAGAYTDTYTWGIQKAVDKTLVEQIGGTVTFTYTVTVTHDAGTISNIGVTGTIAIFNTNTDTNGNTIPVTIDSVSDVLSDNTTCKVSNSGPVTLSGPETDLTYSCVLLTVPGSDTNTVTINWSTQYGGSLAGGSASFTSPTISFTPTLVDNCVTVTDTLGGSLGTACVGTDPNPKTFTYQNTVNVPTNNCTTVNNTATFTTNTTGTTGSASQSVEVCGPAKTGALTMGYWQNKNGQNIVLKDSGTNCQALRTWLNKFNEYNDLTSTTCGSSPSLGAKSASGVVGYVYTTIKNATCSSTSKTCNTMLKAQDLATSLDVYFSDPTLGGNQIGAPGPIGGVSIDLAKICQMIDGSGGTATCSGTFEDASSEFAPGPYSDAAGSCPAAITQTNGSKPMTVMCMLENAATWATGTGGATWYSNVKATQTVAKDAFDAINNGVAFAP